MNDRQTIQEQAIAAAIQQQFASRLLIQEHSDYSWEQAVRILRRNARLVSVLSVITIAFAAGLAWTLPDVYQPKALLEIDSPDSGIRTLHEIEGARPADNQEYVETETQILQSDSLAINVIRSLQLDREPELLGTMKLRAAKSAPAKVLNGAALITQDVFLKKQLELAERSPAETAALTSFRKRLTISPIRSSRIVEVSFASHDPALAQQVTNALVTQFIDQNYKARYASTMEASDWLSAQLNDLRAKLERSNQAVSDYQKKYNLVEADDRDIPLGQLMNEVNRQLSDAQASRIEAEAFVRMIDLGRAEAVPALRDDQLYQSLMTRYVDVRAQLAQARAVYGDENSNVKKLENESKELSARLDDERTRMTNRLRTGFSAAVAREQMMLDAREKLRAQMGDASSHLVAYRMLKNEAMANAQLYNTLDGRLKEAGIYAGLRSSNIRVIDFAALPDSPVAPHRKIIFTGVSLLGCLFALLLAFMRQSFDNKVRTPDDIQRWTGLRSLGALPHVKDAPVEQVHSASANRPDSRPIHAVKSRTLEAEAIRQLRTTLLASGSGSYPRTILVSSGTGAEGKSTLALNLAIALAQGGKACLVDADIRQPTISRAVDLESKPGLTEVLSNHSFLSDCLTAVHQAPGLHILSAGSFVESPADSLSSDSMRQLIGSLKMHFDYIILDSPPAILFSDARILASLVDAVVLVGRYGVTTRRSLQRCADLFEEIHAPVFGAVLNDVDYASPDFEYYSHGYRGSIISKTVSLAVGPTSDVAGSAPAKKGRSAHA